MIYGLGANTNHWRFNQPILTEIAPTYAIDLLGFGRNEQPRGQLNDETQTAKELHYSFDLWGQHIADFCQAMIGTHVVLVGNLIGEVVALLAVQLLGTSCQSLVLVDCAQRLMVDKQIDRLPAWMHWIRPLLKRMVRQRWIRTSLFQNAARPNLIRSVPKQAYPSGDNIDIELVNLLFQPTQVRERQKLSMALSIY